VSQSGAAAAPVDAYVALGSNLGDPVLEVERALAEIADLPATELGARSSLYRTAPIDAGGDDYVNAVVHLRTALAPAALLDALQAIERAHGRKRTFPNAPRTLDLDLLLHGEAVVVGEALTLPHPRLHERAFVLVPLAEIAPGLVVPGRGAIAALAAAVAGQRVAKLDR
jgi:2-amino-4-hydroxy-6-hydroxymethyldihydropteridine diphosphokinase